MAIPLPNLDDRSFADLVEEMRALIPRYAPTWTDHNVSDPGIMLIELFAWLTEALIYRLNRIPTASEVRFLELLGATFNAARPATAALTVTADGLQGDLALLGGTSLVAVSSERGEAVRFETLYDLQLTPDAQSGIVVARQAMPLQSESLGVSGGLPYQLFPLAQSFLLLDPETPFAIVPQVKVSGETWTFQADLLDSAADDTHFTVEPHFNGIRFGSGGWQESQEEGIGKIPPAGAEIVANYYYTLGEKGNLPPGTEFEVDVGSSSLSGSLKEALGAGVSLLIIAESGASGGVDPTSLEEARDQVVGALKNRWRAVTADDFEALVLSEDFATLMAGEEFGGRFSGQGIPEIARVRCLPESNLEASDPSSSCSGHVSVIIVPEARDEKDQMPQPSEALLETVWDILDERRLITCKHHVVGPTYTDVCIEAEVTCTPQPPKGEMGEQILANLETFFHPLQGGSEGEGWPFGRDVYASEVYQVIEGTAGVDHVESLVLYSREDADEWEASSQVAIAPNNLVHFDRQASRISTRVG